MPVGDYFHGTRVYRVGEQPRPISTGDASVLGAMILAPAADDAKFPLNTVVTMFSDDTAMRTALGTGGNVAEVFHPLDANGVTAEVQVVRFEEGAGATPQEKLEATIVNIVGSGANNSGVHAFREATKPAKLLIAPGYDSQRISNAKNPVAAELHGIAELNKAMKILNTPMASKEAAEEYREDFTDDPRGYLFHPGVTVISGAGTIVRPGSGYVAARFIAQDQAAGGPFQSPSNTTIGGITGPSRPIVYRTGQTETEANYLNSIRIATLRAGNILWGNETCAEDPLDRFVNVVRTNDWIDDAVLNAFMWAIDKNISVPLAVSVLQSLDQFGDELVRKGAVLGFRAWFDGGLNGDLSMASGVLRFDYDREPAAPLQDLQFGASRNVAYYAEVRNGILTTLDRLRIAA
ncbi:tail sheath protein [Camelimonas fluminis]|uniref:Phage tail sheath family protein n=1 Tax=Camelimonas fluminis TaxID=1576911 RepID=A0ABV7UFR4_9HYPH|nr:phage tail sheath C-terminal domain-containing protein [Camelimonas fluminis]GHE72336.1 tail sheath protein [Camelimonas fluminis]